MINGKLYSVTEVEKQNIDVLSCRPGQAPKVISGNTLGGQWFVQTVGTAASKAAVLLRVVGESTRQAIIALWSTGSSFIIACDGKVYTGFILDEPAHELLSRGEPAARQYSMTFNFAIVSEDVLS